MVTYGLVCTNGVDLGAEHHRGEDEEEETLKAQEYKEDDCCWGREGTALWEMEGHGRKVEGQRKGSYEEMQNYNQKNYSTLPLYFCSTTVRIPSFKANLTTGTPTCHLLRFLQYKQKGLGYEDLR